MTVVPVLGQSLLNQVCLSVVQNDLRVTSVDHRYPHDTDNLTVGPSPFLGTPVFFRSLLRVIFYLRSVSLLVPSIEFLSPFEVSVLLRTFGSVAFLASSRRNFFLSVCARDFCCSPTFVTPAVALSAILLSPDDRF